MAPEDSASAFSGRHHIASSGENTGAVILVHGAEAGHCCCVNIYVNNNIQGVTNSVLFGSKVIMRDPGVQLMFHKCHGGEEAIPVFERTRNVNSTSYVMLGFFMLWFALLGFVLLLVGAFAKFRICMN